MIGEAANRALRGSRRQLNGTKYNLRALTRASKRLGLRSKTPIEGPPTHPLQRGMWAESALGGRFRTQPSPCGAVYTTARQLAYSFRLGVVAEPVTAQE